MPPLWTFTPSLARGLRENVAQVGRNRFREAHVRGDATSEKSVVGPLAGAIEKLRGQEHIARRVFFLQTAYRRHADNPPDIQRTERIDIRAMIQLVRKQPVSASVPGQEINLPSMHLPSDDRIGGIAKRCFDALLGRVFHPLHLIEAASADDANCRCISIHF